MSREVEIGQAGRGRALGVERLMGTAAAYGGKGFKGGAAVSGERPIGAASWREQHNQVSCPPPTPIQGCQGEQGWGVLRALARPHDA